MQESINNQSMLKVGTILHGTYRIDNYLSSGGFGNTYVATNVEFEERVAIKEFFMKGVTQRDDNQTTVSVSNLENTNSFLEQKEKFKKEARRLRKMQNEHLVRVHDLFDENGTAYYVMDYVDGENLSERLKRTGRTMTESEVRLILPQILDALKAVHNEGFCHLDIKPSNIMLEKGGKIKLIDFGASKQLGANGTLTTNAPTAFAQTPGYAPREQMEQNLDKIGPWTDIYALGATLYNLLTNNKPPLPTDIDDDMSEDKHVALPFPENVGELKFLVLQMLNTNRMQRPQSVNGIINSEKSRKVTSQDAPQYETTALKAASYEDEETIISAPIQKENKSESKLQSNYDESTIINGYVPNSINNDIIYNLKSIAKNMDNYDSGPYYFKEGFAAVQKQGKYGFIDRNGIEAISCIYEDYGEFHEGLANVKLHGKWGYIDKKNNTVVPFIYESTSDCHEGFSDFHEGLALVKKNNRYGYIDNTGREVIPCIYESARPFSEGLACVVTNGKTGYIDISGNMIIPQLYDRGFSFHNGIAVVRNTHKKFFIEIDREGGIDKYGNEVIPIVYDSVSNFGADNLAVVCKSDKYGLIDKNGKLLIPCIYKDALRSDGLIPVKQNNKWGFINASGNVVIPFKFFFANGFSDEMCRVEDKHYLYGYVLYGYVNKYGSEIIPCKYHDAAQFFCDGFASVKMDNQWGIVNNKGKLIVPCIYDWCGAFQDGLAFVKKNGLSGCVDKEGRSSFDYKK